jgi:ABC-type transport system involved in Fe-S cluster assembly fused permease/ATPase subunit
MSRYDLYEHSDSYKLLIPTIVRAIPATMIDIGLIVITAVLKHNAIPDSISIMPIPTFFLFRLFLLENCLRVNIKPKHKLVTIAADKLPIKT